MTGTGTLSAVAATPDTELALLDLANRLGGLLDEPRAEGARPIGEAWVEAVRNNLSALHERLVAEFREDERSGLPARLIAGVPQIADRVACLRSEHERILDELQALVEAADNVGAQGPVAYARLQEATSETLQRLFRTGGLESDRPLLVYS